MFLKMNKSKSVIGFSLRSCETLNASLDVFPLLMVYGISQYVTVNIHNI